MIKKIKHYLDLYKQNYIHGEFLLDFVRSEYSRIYKNLDPQFEKAIEDFLAKNELYESSQPIRDAELHLTGDEKLINEVIKLQNFIFGKKFNANFIPKSIDEEEDLKKVLFKYIELYKNNDIDEDDFLLFLWVFLNGRYMSIDYLLREMVNEKEIVVKLQEVKELHDSKTLIGLKEEEKKYVIETMFLIQKYL